MHPVPFGNGLGPLKMQHALLRQAPCDSEYALP